MGTTGTKKSTRCKKHPNYNPFDILQNEKFNKDCETCYNLHYGAKRIGHFSGEFNADSHDISNARTKIGPLNLEQLGIIRYSLGWDYHFEDVAPMWYIDEKTSIIYLNEKLNDNRIQEFRKMKCKISTLEWKKHK